MRPFLILVAVLFFPMVAWSQTPALRTEVDIMRGKRLDRPAERAQVVKEVRQRAFERRSRAQKKARELGLPLRTTRKDGTVKEVVDLDDRSGQPLYFTTHNLNAAISTGANKLRLFSGLSGLGVVVGVWDSGTARPSHQEFTSSRLVAKDGGRLSDHSTHVAGTIIAAGIQSTTAGMAPSARVDSYDWTSDTSEMISRAATSPNDSSRIKISNHSYGYVRGWDWNGTRYSWHGLSGNSSTAVETAFGLYNARARSIDSIAYNAPYYLMFFSAGNHRNNNPPMGSSVLIGGSSTTYNSSIHPPGDGVYKSGYDTLADHAVSKNVIVVGAVNDAVLSGNREPSRATLTSFTAWGPSDDGRIKPDLVANGASVYSSLGTSDNAYGTYSGTSMSSPNAAGTAALLVEHHSNLLPGQGMRASTLRGLLIHTADDLGRPGPDYQYGWGLVNAEAARDLITDHASDAAKLRMREDFLIEGQVDKFHQFVWDGVSPIRATVCWSDPPGNTFFSTDNRAKHLINDLNVRMVAPNGAIFYPFVMPFVGKWTQSSLTENATTGVNSVDNVEQIYIPTPSVPGVYRLEITHTGNLSGNEQHYSLLVSGSRSSLSPPSVSPISDVVVDEDFSPIQVSIELESPNTAPEEITISATSDNSSLVESISVEGDSLKRMLTITLVPDANGSATIEITVFDGFSSSRSTFSLIVNPVNDPPQIVQLGDILLDPSGTPVSIPLEIKDVDNSLEALIVTASLAHENFIQSADLSVEGTTTKNLTITAPPERYGQVIVEVFVSDGELSTGISFVVQRVNPNPPFEEWIASRNQASTSGLWEDIDGDGIPNVMEYFHGLDPVNPYDPAPVTQTISTNGVIFEYRKNRMLNGLDGSVKWSSSLASGENWSSEGVVDTPVYRGEDYEWRRAMIPWPTGKEKIFVRIELITD